MLAQNLTNLRNLTFNFADMSDVALPSFLNLTSSLERLSLRDCQLHGEFPSEVFCLPYLQHIDPASLTSGSIISHDSGLNNSGEDLSEFGVGKEGWLAPDASTTLLCALDAHSLAIANRSLILILGWSDPDEPRVQILGTSRGFILVYSLRGDLIHRQSNQRYYCAVTIGDDAVISAFRLSEDRNRSLDHPRKGEKLTLSPSCTLAAITDSLGRILLLDTQALVVVRLWRVSSASMVFNFLKSNRSFILFVNTEAIGSGSSYYEPGKSDYCLCLAIHAPRKGIVEVWQMRTGPRLLTIQCAKGCRLLQPTYRFGSSLDSPYVPLDVFLLNGDSGQLSVLNRVFN
ncbi:Uncharacterized protein TCM_031843 [Theobroma cacao]|uniref:Rab3-GAP regulatory subunit N-terminal domain-containing protein n=1 Tax=Theobroma cacao TaxID=3641 RepID=A0A061F8D5_THECC|nr:Uncharacterized protein TCM_031843 [Theobroma cacao]